MSEARSNLFAIPYQTRRENFVRKCFGEEGHFGNERIETLLKLQKIADEPDCELWSRLLPKLAKLPFADSGTQLTGLPSKHVQSLGDEPSSTSTHILNRVRRELRPDSGSGGRFYVGLNRGGFVCLRTDSHHPLVIAVEGDHCVVRPLIVDDVLDAKLATWVLGDRAKAQSAQASLCRDFERVIDEVRKQAEANFNKAVACSADGHKIVHADWVVVTRGDRKPLVYPGEVFQRDKILCLGKNCPGLGHELWGCGYAEDVGSFHLEERTDLLQRVELLPSNPGGRIFAFDLHNDCQCHIGFEYGRKGETKEIQFFVTPISTLTSLPEGGREIE